MTPCSEEDEEDASFGHQDRATTDDHRRRHQDDVHISQPAGQEDEEDASRGRRQRTPGTSIS